MAPSDEARQMLSDTRRSMRSRATVAVTPDLPAGLCVVVPDPVGYTPWGPFDG